MRRNIALFAALPASIALAACDAEVPMDETEMTAAGSAAAEQNVDFGDDASTWANDGECDDPRFEGPDMTPTTLLEEDILHDATDCREAFVEGKLQLRQ